MKGKPMADKPKTMQVLMLRGTQLPGEDGLFHAGPGTVHTVNVDLGQWLIWKEKARAATPEDAALAKPKGPIDSAALPGGKK